MLGFLFGKQSKNNITSKCFVVTSQCCFISAAQLFNSFISIALPSETLRVFENKVQRDLGRTKCWESEENYKIKRFIIHTAHLMQLS
jgi:hypothetical protein